MKLFVGLGNPGEEYVYTWHNAGFLAVEYIAEKLRAGFEGTVCRSLVASGQWRGERVIFAKPQTYMNRSGGAVRDLLIKYSVGPDALTVMHDDIDIELGKVKKKVGGGSAGHNGIASIMEELDTGEFTRLRIGVGRPPEGMDAAEYVLSPYDEEGGKVIAQSVEECYRQAFNLK